MDINDIIMSLGATKINAAIAENCTDAELYSHLKNNVQGVVLTVQQVREQAPLLQAKAATENAKAAALAELNTLDLQSIRALREYIAAQPDAPQLLKERETAAQAARAKIK